MPKFIVKYTLESWREVIVEAKDFKDAQQKFFNGECDWDTDREYDIYLDYDSADVYIYDEERIH